MGKFRACYTSCVTSKKLHRLEQLAELPFSCHRPHTGWYMPSNIESKQKKKLSGCSFAGSTEINIGLLQQYELLDPKKTLTSAILSRREEKPSGNSRNPVPWQKGTLQTAVIMCCCCKTHKSSFQEHKAYGNTFRNADGNALQHCSFWVVMGVNKSAINIKKAQAANRLF